MPVIANQMWAIHNLELIKAAVEGAKSVLICGHCNPDGDSMGASRKTRLNLNAPGYKTRGRRELLPANIIFFKVFIISWRIRSGKHDP